MVTFTVGSPLFIFPASVSAPLLYLELPEHGAEMTWPYSITFPQSQSSIAIGFLSRSQFGARRFEGNQTVGWSHRCAPKRDISGFGVRLQHR